MDAPEFEGLGKGWKITDSGFEDGHKFWVSFRLNFCGVPTFGLKFIVFQSHGAFGKWGDGRVGCGSKK